MAAQLLYWELEQWFIDKELWWSSKFGDLERVKQALHRGANLSYHYSGITPHIIAYINGHNTIVQFLENAGATPDYDEIMLTAAVRGLVDIVKEALKKNVNVNAKHQDKDDNTALHLASLNGHTEIVQFLLQSNADPNIYNKWGHSPLHIAYWNKHDDIVKLLCSFGARDMDQVINDDLLLTSAENGDIHNVTKALISGANVNVHHGHCDKDQQTTLHLASKEGYYDIVQQLLNYNADANICNEYQQTALYVASNGGYCDIVQILLNSNADPNICDVNHQTPLHLASKGDIVQLLLNSNADPNICDVDHQTALHLASKGDIVHLLLKFNADPNIRDVESKTPAHYAAENGCFDVLKLLIEVGQTDINAKDNVSKTPAHYAAENGHGHVLKLLIEVGQADINAKDNYGRTPAHCAAYEDHVVLKLLIELGQADINAIDKGGNNLLHIACQSGNRETIRYLLHNVQLNPDHLIALNNDQQMPLDCIPPSNSNRFQLLKLFQPFKQCHRDYLTESYAKVFLCGKTEAGKSSLAAVISHRAKNWFHMFFDQNECVEGVVLQTTGIEYHSVCSREIGNVVIFDFAGHAEYYSSHAAVLETLLLRSPAVFAILSNLTDDKKTIKKDLLFWFNFVENVSMKLISSSEVLVLGSHIDELPSEKDFHPFVNDIANLGVRFQNYKGFLPVDCHRPFGKGVKTFMEKLKESCEAVVDKNDKMSYHCHCLNSYLQQLEVVAISLDELCSKLIELNEPCLLTDQSTVLEFLTILGSKGLILFLANTWVIIDKKALLTEVNGVLFNKSIDRERKPVASNTGIMPVSTLANLFKNHNTDMLISFLTSLQFCHEMDSYAVSTITNNIPSDDFPISKDEKFLFFPALITADKPTSIFETTDGFGWCLWCPESHQFLSMRFLHTLLHHLAYTSCPPPLEETDYITDNAAIEELHRVCTMWKNGIYWKEEENNVEVMVEVTEANRCVTVLVSHSSLIESYQLRASLIKEVLNLKKELCPCTSKQFIIAPGNVKDVMEYEQENRILYALRNVAKGVLTRKTITSSTGKSVAVQLVVGKKEPYLSIAPLVTKALFTDTNKDLPLPDHYLQHIKEVCGEIMSLYPSSNFTHFSVREHVNKFSIFAGRNPLSIPSPPIKDDVIQRLSKHVQTRTTKDYINPVTKPDKQMSSSITYNVGSSSQVTMLTKDSLTDEFSHFPKLFERPTRRELLIQLADINALWRSIGDGLGVSDNDLQSLANDNKQNQTRLGHVIQNWFDMNGQGEGAPVTWKTILDVVKGPLVKKKAHAMTIYEYLKQNTQTLAKRKRSSSHSMSKKLKQSDNTDNDAELAYFIVDTKESYLESANWVESNDNDQSIQYQKNECCLRKLKLLSPSLHESSTTQKETKQAYCKRKSDSNFNSDDLPKTKKYAQEQQESNVRGVITQADKNIIDEQSDGGVAQTDKNTIIDEQDINECVSESIREDYNAVSGKVNASKIFQVHSADLCDIIVDANPHRIVNRLVSADLLPSCAKEDVKSTTDVYDKADKIVEKLQRQIDDDEHPIELLKKICDFLLEQTDKTLKDIGTKMMSQL